MPRLLLYRHAKSSWDEPGITDRQRPLAPRGVRAATQMATVIAGAEFAPDRILCSPARRTRETLAPLLTQLADPDVVAIVDDLYEPAAGDYRKLISTHGGSAQRLLVIGHNPAIQTTALNLVGSGDEILSNQLSAKFPTGALAVIDFDQVEWSRITPKSGRLNAFIRPRDLEED